MLRRTQRLSKITLAFALVLVGNLPDTALAETTMSWTDNGYAVNDVTNFPMADGSTQQNYVSKVIYTGLDGDMAGQTYVGDCIGTGNVGADAKYIGNFTCTITLSAEDAYTVHIDHDDGVAMDFVVTGGKGKFKGATGGGKATYTWGDTNFGDRLAFTNVVTITLP